MSKVQRTKIVGQEKIQFLFQRELDTKWKQLEGSYSNIKGKILFVLLLLINDISKSIAKSDDIDVENYLRLPILLLILDELLVRNWNIVDLPNPDDVQGYVDKVVKEFQIIGRIKNRAIESEAINEECIILENGKTLADIPFQSDIAFDDWIRRSPLDEDWIEYYHRESTIATKLTESFRTEFTKKYGITPRQLYAFEKSLSSLSRKRLEGEGMPFLHFSHDELLSVMNKAMSQVEPVDIEKAKEFLKELEYSPDRHWSRSPFLKVRYGSTFLYALLLPAIHSLEVLIGAWLEDVLKGSRTLGMRSKDYGRHFEEYVRELLRKHHPRLEVNKGRLRIKKSRYSKGWKSPGISRIEIDVVAQSDTHVYLFSCKAMDQSVGSKLLLTFFLREFKTFFGNIEWDLEKATEISDWTDCIRHLPKFIEDRGFTGKEFVPCLVTSDLRPLNLDSVQQWCLNMEVAYNLPEAKVIQAKTLKDFAF
ncbi:MAG: hypothetical protein ACW98Y_09505 [Candidatus Thorarchaeota archaeon]|jgi:hypothetical protein